MQGIKNYTVYFYSKDEYPETRNVTAEDALLLMKAVDIEKKHVIVGGEMFAVHQISKIVRNMEAERDECYGKILTAEERKSLDVRNLKHGTPKLNSVIKKIKPPKND
jgi:hypothetical protein